MKFPVSMVLVFLVAAMATLLGVLFFFKPIAESDTTIYSASPVVGLVVYTGLCTAIYFWAFSETGSIFKAALVVALPQMALIVDLSLRGDRGWVTTLAGGLLLLITWGNAAIAHKALMSSDKKV